MLLQLFINMAISSSMYILVGLSFSLIYSTVRFFHFAHAIVFTSGAYFTFFLNAWCNLPILLAILLASILSSFVGCYLDIWIYRPMRHKNSSPLILMLASLGIYIVLQNMVSIVFGDDTKSIRSTVVREGLSIFGARITATQVLIISISIVFVICMAVFLQKAKLGKAMRAVANDCELADISGVDTNQVILLTFAIGSFVAGLAGALIALDTDMTPTMGMNALMMGVVAVIIGGVGSIPGIALGALLLGMAQHMGVWYISSQWQDAIAFVILLIFLLFRPQGFLGKKVKKVAL